MENQPRKVTVQDIFDYHMDLDAYAREGAKTVVSQQPLLAQLRWEQKLLLSCGQLEQRELLSSVYYHPSLGQRAVMSQLQRRLAANRGSFGVISDPLSSLGNILGGIFK